MAERERDRTDTITSDWEYSWTKQKGDHSYYPVELLDSGSGSYTSKETRSVMTDVVTPNFAKLQAQGRIINNPMSKQTIVEIDALAEKQEYQSYYIPCGTCGGNGHEQWFNLEGTWPSSVLLADAGVTYDTHSFDDSDTIALAVNKAWGRIDVSDIQSLVMFAEGQKTIASMASISKRFIKIIKSIKRLNVKRLAKELSAKELSDRYMELRYAIRPLLYDTRGVINTFIGEEIPERITFRGKELYHDEGSSHVVTSYDYGGPLPCGWKVVKDKEWCYDVTVRAGVLTQVQRRDLVKKIGLDLPIESLWEVIPFSFVVDWFFNVGDTISAWTPNFGLNSLTSWYVLESKYFQKRSMYYSDVYNSVSDPTRSWCGGFNWTLDNCYTSHTQLLKVRVPEPRRTILPTFSVKLNCLKLIDLVIIAKNLWR